MAFSKAEIASSYLSNTPKAKPWLIQATTLQPDDAVAWINQGLALGVLERYEDAISAFEKAIELNPESHKAWNYKGEMLVKLEKEQEAIESFDRATQIEPKYAPAYYNKATCFALQEQVKSAIENLEQAIRINPKYRQEAKSDRDFEAISEDDRFWQLVEG